MITIIQSHGGGENGEKFEAVQVKRMRLSELEQCKRCRSAAFTLVEVMVAVFVLTIIMVALYGGFSYGFTVVQLSREDLRATQILVQKAEAVRICNWVSLQTNCPMFFQERYDPLGGTNTGGITYYGTMALTAPTNIPSVANYKSNVSLLNVTLNWTNYTGTRVLPHTRQLQTLVARNGLQNYIW